MVNKQGWEGQEIQWWQQAFLGQKGPQPDPEYWMGDVHLINVLAMEKHQAISSLLLQKIPHYILEIVSLSLTGLALI